MRLLKTAGGNLTMPGVTYRAGNMKKDIPDWVLLQGISNNYYSGLDMSCYFNDIFMDEIIQLSFQELEQTRTNFGYADYTFRSVTHGSRMVQGTFATNFKEAGYLVKLLGYLRDPSEERARLLRLSAENLKDPKSESAEKQRDTLDLKYLALKGDFTLEDFINATKDVNKLKQQGYGDGTGVFTELMDALTGAFWGDSTDIRTGANTTYSVTERNALANIDHFMHTSKFYTTENGFDIILKYGQPENDPVTDADTKFPRWGTLETIKNCHITGVSKAADDSGRNIVEVYQFVASTVA